MKLKVWYITLVLVLLAGILAGCGTATETSAVPADGAASQAGGGSEATASTALNESYEGALPVSNQLALGIILLEGTENAITSEQAQELLPLWQVIESGALKGQDETDAVIKQIQGAMTSEQLTSIATMQLTAEEMGAWAQEQGVTMGGPGGSAGGFAPREGMAPPDGVSEEELAEMRAARQSGEGGFGPPEGMTEEQMAEMRATAEAGGMTRPEGTGGMGGGQLTALAGPLVEMLTQLARS